ncbi:hypothetical protein QL285_031679 [Trifolium repens]|nr:hypothetical protein QL285_031679 [Trifolium repens]
MPFSIDHRIKVVNREKNDRITCTVMKDDTKTPQFDIGGFFNPKYYFSRRSSLGYNILAGLVKECLWSRLADCT